MAGLDPAISGPHRIAGSTGSSPVAGCPGASTRAPAMTACGVSGQPETAL